MWTYIKFIWPEYIPAFIVGLVFVAIYGAIGTLVWWAVSS